MRTTGPAVWRAHDSDLPIVVTGELGPGPDGRIYLSIEGSGTGVPADEVHWFDSTKLASFGVLMTELRLWRAGLKQFVKGGSHG